MNDSLQEFVQPEPEIGEITDKVAEELKTENEGVVMESLVSVFCPALKNSDEFGTVPETRISGFGSCFWLKAR